MIKQEDNPIFALLLTSLTIILLAFFIFLNSIASPHSIKEKIALSSLERQFYSHSKAGSRQDKEDTGDILAPEIIKHFPRMSRTPFYSKIKTIVEEGGGSVKHSKRQFIITFPSELIFIDRNEQINARFLPVLGEIVREIREKEFFVDIQSHTDGLTPLPGEHASSWELSTRSAAAIYRFFLDSGIPPEQLRAAGYGEFHPLLDNTTEHNRRKNRRISLILGSSKAETHTHRTITSADKEKGIES